MKVGEIWQDKTDGDKVKIVGITEAYIYETGKYSAGYRGYIVTISDLEGKSGGDMFGHVFLKQYEKRSEVMVCK